MAFYLLKKKKREREKCALEYMNKHCSIDFDHICLRVITLYKKNCIEMVSSIIRIHSI